MSFDKKDILIAIGNLAVEFSKLEFHLTFFIENLISSQKMNVSETITAELSVRAKIDLLMSLFRQWEHEKKVVAELESILARVSKVSTARNTIIHSHYMFTEKTVHRFKKSAKFEKGFHVEMERNFSVEKINIVTERVIRRDEELWIFAQDWILERKKLDAFDSLFAGS